MNPLGIYVQVPFCQTKCTYCNFHTGVVATGRFAPYIDAAIREIGAHKTLYESAGISLPHASTGWRVDTVYIGGGTPSLLDPSLLHRLLDQIRSNFHCELVEVTLEADPETIEVEKAAAWAKAGINRISFGLQSFSDKELIAAGRMHRREDIYKAVPLLRAAGIRNISVDLIAGLPFQTPESWSQSLAELQQLQPEHVSVYLLEIDEGSRLGKEVLQGGAKYSARELPSEEQMAEFYELAQETLARAGYHHYEISNWARPGFESKHNLKYWRREPYLGFGAGAHSFSGAQRWANAHDSAAYVQSISQSRLPVEQLETVSVERALEEELFLGLRQLDGIDVARIEEQYGVHLASRFDPLMSAGLVERAGHLVKLAPARLSVSNEVFVELLR
jgi:putative oxygen-independent coproporphyrinogen III oxidase